MFKGRGVPQVSLAAQCTHSGLSVLAFFNYFTVSFFTYAIHECSQITQVSWAYLWCRCDWVVWLAHRGPHNVQQRPAGLYVRCLVCHPNSRLARTINFPISGKRVKGNFSRKMSLSLIFLIHKVCLINKKLQQTTKNTFGPGTHFPDDQSIRILILWAIRFALIQI